MTDRKIAAAFCALALSACAGKSGAGPLPRLREAQRAIVNVTMHWPAIAAKSGSRVPKWISPSTKSVVVQVNDSAQYTTIANNPSTGGPVTGSLSVPAPPGNDLIAFLLYDQPDGKGNVVGQATVTQQITAGQPNTVNATVDGIVASVRLQPLPNQPWIATSVDSSNTTQFALKGDASATFAATALDADGNVIVPAASPITYNVTAVTSKLTVAPVNGQPNQFTIRGSGMPSSQPFGLVAHAYGGQSAIAQTNYLVQLGPLLYVTYGNGSTATVATFDSTGTRVMLPGAFSGITSPLAAAFDPSDHRFFVLDGASHAVVAFNTDGTAASIANIPSPLGIGLTYDSANNELYVLNRDKTVATFHAADGSAAAAPAAWPGITAPVAIYAQVPSTDMLFVANADGTLVFFDGTGAPIALGPMHRSSFNLGLTPAGLSGNSGAGNLYFAGSNAGTPTAMEMALTGAQLASTTTGLDSPVAIAYDGGLGLVYVANTTSGTICAYDDALSQQTTSVAPPVGLSHPSTVTVVY